MHNGSEAEVSMFIGGNGEEHVLTHAVQGWTHSDMASNLHCWETTQWRHDELVKIHEKTSIVRLEGRKVRRGGILERGKRDPRAY